MNTIIYGLIKASAVNNNNISGDDEQDTQIRDARRTLALTGALTGFAPGALLSAAAGDPSFGLLGGALGALAGGGLGYLEGRTLDKFAEKALEEEREANDAIIDALRKTKKRKK